MKNKILLTVAMALIGLFTFSTTAEAQCGRGVRGNNIVWQNDFGPYGAWGTINMINSRMCIHMRNIWGNGRFGNGFVRCNHRGCGMFGNSFRNGRFFNQRGVAIFIGRGNQNGRFFNQRPIGRNGRYFNQRGNRGNGRNFNQGGNRGNGRNFNQGGNRGNGRNLNQGGNRGGNRGNNGGGNRGNGRNGGRG